MVYDKVFSINGIVDKELLLNMGQKPNITDWEMDNCVKYYSDRD